MNAAINGGEGWVSPVFGCRHFTLPRGRISAPARNKRSTKFRTGNVSTTVLPNRFSAIALWQKSVGPIRSGFRRFENGGLQWLRSAQSSVSALYPCGRGLGQTSINRPLTRPQILHRSQAERGYVLVQRVLLIGTARCSRRVWSTTARIRNCRGQTLYIEEPLAAHRPASTTPQKRRRVW